MSLMRCDSLTVSVLMLAAAGGCAPQHRELRSGVMDTLNRQVDAWNKGDIDGFMDGYWRSDDLTFSTGGRVTRGWTATRDRYRTRYGSREKMGVLDFSDLEIRPIGRDAALVLGRWRLERQDGTPSGNFSLVMVKHSGRWLVVHDHTSSDEPPDPPSSN